MKILKTLIVFILWNLFIILVMMMFRFMETGSFELVHNLNNSGIWLSFGLIPGLFSPLLFYME